MSANGDRIAPPEELRRRILAEVARTPAPTRTEHKRRSGVTAGLGAFATMSLFFAMGGFVTGSRPVELVAFAAGFGLLTTLALGRLSSGASGSMLGRPRHVLVLACAVTAPVLALVALAAATFWPGEAAQEVPTEIHLLCGGITILQGALPLAALLLPRRGTDPVHPAVTGAALGMTAGAWTATMAYLRCPHAGAGHCIFAHVLPTLVLTAAGALLGHVVLRIRS